MFRIDLAFIVAFALVMIAWLGWIGYCLIQIHSLPSQSSEVLSLRRQVVFGVLGATASAGLMVLAIRRTIQMRRHWQQLHSAEVGIAVVERDHNTGGDHTRLH